jgi:hypothetical protein
MPVAVSVEVAVAPGLLCVMTIVAVGRLTV